MPLGGVWPGEPVLAKHPDGHLEIFAVGTDGYLWRKHQNGPNQPFVNDWGRFPTHLNIFAYSEDVVCDPLTALPAWTFSDGPVYVFLRNARGRIIYSYPGNFPTGWSDWKSLTAIQDGHPTMGNPITTRPPLRRPAPGFGKRVLVRARDGSLLVLVLAGTGPEYSVRDFGTRYGPLLAGEPATISGATSVLSSIYMRGCDGIIHRIGGIIPRPTPDQPFPRDFESEWRPLTSPNAVAGRIVPTTEVGDVLWRGTNNHLWQLSQPGLGSYGPPQDLGFEIAGDPAFTIFEEFSSTGRENCWVFWRTPDGTLQMRLKRSGGSWQPPRTIWNGVPVISNPSANTSANGRAEVVFVGADCQMYHLRETRPASGTFIEGA